MNYADLDWRNQRPFSEKYDDIYYSSGGAISEFEHVFFNSNHLPARWQKVIDEDSKVFTIAELGFGSGTNFVLTARAWLDFLKRYRSVDASVETETLPCLQYLAIEKHPLSPLDIRRIAEAFPELSQLFDEMLSVYPLPLEGVHSRLIFGGRIQIHFIFMDADKALRAGDYQVDAWYMDGFSPAKNPALWSKTLCLAMAANSIDGATLATYSAAGGVKRNLEAAGFDVRKIKGHGNKRQMIVASLPREEQAETMLFSERPWYSYAGVTHKNVSCLRTEAVVIGTGIAGLTAAQSLAQRGWKVTMVDRKEVAASGASGNPAGLITPKLSLNNPVDMTFYGAAFLLANSRINQMQLESEEIFWHSSGCYQVMAAARIDKLRVAGLPDDYVRFLDKENVPDFFNLDVDEGLLFYRQAGVVEAAKLCTWLKSDILKPGNSGFRNRFIAASVAGLEFSDGLWSLLDMNGACIIQSPVVVVANGTGAGKLNITGHLPLESVRGQVSVYHATTESNKLKHAINAAAYVTPAIDGKHHVGASYHINDTEKTLRVEDQENNLAAISTVADGLFHTNDVSSAGGSGLEGRVSFRMTSRDRVPVVGAMPDLDWYQQHYADIQHGRKGKLYQRARYLPGLYVSLGHGSRGFTSAFLAAEIITSLASGLPLPVSREVADYLHPSRFILNQLKRR